MKLKEGDKCVCPWCFHEYEEEIGDFVIMGRVGADSIALWPERCEECDKSFTVEYVGMGEYQYIVEGVDDDYEDEE